MAKYVCDVCEYIYDEEENETKWDELPDNWTCPVCDASKKFYDQVIEMDVPSEAEPPPPVEEKNVTLDLKKTMAETEKYFADIHEMAETGKSIYEPMRTKLATVSWDDILIKGAQLAKIPLNNDEEVTAQTIIGPKANQPLVINTPVFISHMSFGALSKEAKIALAKGSAAMKTAMCSGEGGILPESLGSAYKYIFEYVPNQYSATEENFKSVDAIEIKIGQSAKPGMGGHLPAEKVTPEIAEVRGFKEGEDIVSPSHFPDINNKEDLKKTVDRLREVSRGKPIGIKIAAGNLEDDLAIVSYADPDFVTIDGRAGATGSSPKFVKAATSVPSIFALSRAVKFLNGKAISLVITGGLRVPSDFAKALAIGADAIAIATSALLAIGCQQYRICQTGKCPMGIATQDPLLRSRLNIDAAANRLSNFLSVSTKEIKDFARLTGNSDVHGLSTNDLCTTNSEISRYTEIGHV